MKPKVSSSGRVHPGLSVNDSHHLLQQLHRQESDTRIPYRLIEPLGPLQARFYFSAHFEGQAVVWDTTLMTLGHYYQTHKNRDQGAVAIDKLQQFIEIPESPDLVRPILIAHALDEIDNSSLLKTIIMVRNYRRLQTGRHSYGEYHTFSAQD